MKQRLVVVRLNQDYDVQLLNELVQTAISPFNELYDFAGVEPDVLVLPTVDDKSPEETPLVDWQLHIVQRNYIEPSRPDGHIITVMPHPMPYYDRIDLGEAAKGRNVFLSTHVPYLDPKDRKSFLHYGPKLVAHGLGHLLLDDEAVRFMPRSAHHDKPTYSKSGAYCLMNMEKYVDAVPFLNKLDMAFCENCYSQFRTGLAKRLQNI